MPPNQSFERTRSAAASGFAGHQLWRAAQLQIRYTAMRNLRRRLASGVFAFLISLAAVAEDHVLMQFSKPGGARVEYRVSDERLAATPAWDVEKDAPPLAIMRAVALAKTKTKPGAERDLLVTSVNLSVSLTSAGYRWYYIVSLYDQEVAASRIPDIFQVMLLMDGSVVESRPHQGS